MCNSNQCKIILAILFSLALTGCSQSPGGVPASAPTVSSRPTYVIDTSPIAKGVLVPIHTAELAFNISGIVEGVNVGIGDEVKAGDALVQLETVTLESNVVRAESALRIAKAEFENSKKQLAPVDLQTVADARIDIAEADLVIARYALEQATLTAPFDGTVVDIQVVPGETVNPGKVVVILADTQRFLVETLDLNELDLPRIYQGQPVVIYIEALDVELEGSVITIVPEAALLGDERVFRVLISLDTQPQGLYWGMSADVKFNVNE